MNKKTVSILLLIVITITVALFSFTSCKNEPNIVPTAAPKPGYVPEIPNNATPLSKVGENDMDSINALTESLGRFFEEYTSTYEDSLDDLQDSATVSLSKPLIISAPDGEGSFGGDAFEYSDFSGKIDLVGSIEPEPSDESFFLIIEGKVTSEVFGEGEHTVRMEYDLMEDNPYYFFLDGSTEPSFYIDADFSDPENYKYYGSESTAPLADNEKIAAVKAKIDLLMFIGYKALSEATVDLDMEAVMRVDDDNSLSVGLNGQIQLSGEYRDDIGESNLDFFDDVVVDLFKSFTATASDLTITATLSTKEGNETESLSATLSISNLALSSEYAETPADDEVTSVSFDKLALSVRNSDDSVILSLEFSDFNLSAQSTDGVPLLNTSTTIGLGIKANDNSVGLVSDIELTSGKITGMPFININPKAAVINGSYYQPEGIKDTIFEYLDMLITAIVNRSQPA